MFSKPTQEKRTSILDPLLRQLSGHIRKMASRKFGDDEIDEDDANENILA